MLQLQSNCYTALEDQRKSGNWCMGLVYGGKKYPRKEEM